MPHASTPRPPSRLGVGGSPRNESRTRAIIVDRRKIDRDLVGEALVGGARGAIVSHSVGTGVGAFFSLVALLAAHSKTWLTIEVAPMLVKARRRC